MIYNKLQALLFEVLARLISSIEETIAISGVHLHSLFPLSDLVSGD